MGGLKILEARLALRRTRPGAWEESHSGSVQLSWIKLWVPSPTVWEKHGTGNTSTHDLYHTRRVSKDTDNLQGHKLTVRWLWTMCWTFPSRIARSWAIRRWR